MRRIRMFLLALLVGCTLLGVLPSAGHAETRDERTFKAMWWSILHPGVGEWYLKGWGGFAHCPQKKFWLGFIPIYGWPGYLQVKSAIDARNGRTNDNLSY